MQTRTAGTKTVLVYRDQLLPPSETFVKLQVQLMQRWQPVLFGTSAVPGGLGLDDVRHHVVAPRAVHQGISGRVTRLVERLGLRQPATFKDAKRLKPDLIHVHFAVDALKAWPLAKALGIPLVVTLHGYDVNIYPKYWQAGNMGEAMRDYPEQLRAMSAEPNVHFIAVSEAIKRVAVDRFGISPEKLHVLYLGIDPNAFPPSGIAMAQRPYKVIFVGRMVEKKGAEVLIRAAAKAAVTVRGLHVTMIGGGPLLDKMKALASELGAPVQFMGAQLGEGVRAQMQDSRLFCLPSVTAENGDAEGLGLVLLEAQASGVPVLTSAVGGKDEAILAGTTGFAFAEGDVNGLADLLATLLPDNEKLTEMANAGPKYVRARHHAKEWTMRLECLYDSILLG